VLCALGLRNCAPIVHNFCVCIARFLRHFCVTESLMDERFKDILDSLPAIPARSSLEPYRELIEALRGRGRKYQEITDILATKCDIHVAVSTVYRFLHKRAAIREPAPRQVSEKARPMENARVLTHRTGAAASYDEIRERIDILRGKPAPEPPATDVFYYDPNEPLHLPDGKTNTRK
jgi:hypothetical protein